MNNVYITSMKVIKGDYDALDGKYVIHDSFSESLNSMQLRSVDRISKLALAAILNALESRGLIIDKAVDNNIELLFGTIYGALDSIHQFDMSAVSKGALTVNPSLFPNTVQNSPACQVGIQFHLLGSILTICNGPVSGLDAVGTAYQHIKNGITDLALAGGIDEISEMIPRMHHSALPMGEAGGFFILEKNKPVKAGLYPEIIDYSSIEYVNDGDEEFIQQVRRILERRLLQKSLIPNDIHKFYFSYPDSKERTIAARVLKDLGLQHSYQMLDVDWMAASGITLIESSLNERSNSLQAPPLDVIICGGNKRVSVIILNYK